MPGRAPRPRPATARGAKGAPPLAALARAPALLLLLLACGRGAAAAARGRFLQAAEGPQDGTGAGHAATEGEAPAGAEAAQGNASEGVEVLRVPGGSTTAPEDEATTSTVPRSSSTSARSTSTSVRSTTTESRLEQCGARTSSIATEYEYPFGNAELLAPSSAPLHTFYMYRVTSDQSYPPINVNMGTLSGILWYLQHEVVIQYPRKFGISKIMRFRVQTRATRPLFQRGMNFGARYAFDKGQATGPFVCGCNASNSRLELCADALDADRQPRRTTAIRGPLEWATYGYFVGCNKLGEFPYPLMTVYYPNATWFSLPGKCSSKQYFAHTRTCEVEQPGGFCPGTPTGTGNCTWNYEPAGEVRIDDLVGISDLAAFHRDGRREYNPDTDQGIRFSWWDGASNQTANLHRLQKARALFELTYPNSTAEDDMLPPPCDFKFSRFYQDLGV